MICGNVHVCHIGISRIHGKELPEQLSVHHEHKRPPHWKQMFDISAKLVSEQNEISGLETIGWENHSWKYMSLFGDERVINLQRTKVYVFSDSVLCLGKIFENPQSNDAWEEWLEWFKSSPVYRNFDRIDGEPMEFEWNIFQGFNTLHLNEEVNRLLLRLGETPENFTGRILFMSMFNDISCGSRDNEKECGSKMPISFLCMQRGSEKDNGHSLVLVLKRSGILSVKIVHKENGTIWRKGWCWNSQKADIQSSVPRVHCPEVDSKAKAMENCRYTIVPIWKRLSPIFHIIVSANQRSLHGAIAEICEEYETLDERTVRPVVMGQSSSSFVSSAIKTEVLLDCDDLAHQDLLLQQYGKRIEMKSYHNKIN